MSLKLVPPREGKSSNYTIRGTYLGISVNRSAKTADRATAKRVLAKIEKDIERGAFSGKPIVMFAHAATAYFQAGGERRFLKPIIKKLGDTPLSDIDQMLIDRVAVEIYPGADVATRNRQFYTPVSAILKRAGVTFAVKRPNGAQGKVRTRWLWPEQVSAILVEAEKADPEFAGFLTLLCYTGLRLEEALGLTVDNVRLDEAFAFIPDTKNEDPRAVFLPPVVVAALANHPRGLDRPGEWVFRYHKSGTLYTKLKKVFARAKVPLGRRDGFHIFRHTFGTWMTRYAGMDAKQLVDTKTWKDIKSAARYSHAVVSEEAAKAALLPLPKKGKTA